MKTTVVKKIAVKKIKIAVVTRMRSGASFLGKRTGCK